jgi:hypothetical protein
MSHPPRSVRRGLADTVGGGGAIYIDRFLPVWKWTNAHLFLVLLGRAHCETTTNDRRPQPLWSAPFLAMMVSSSILL